MNSELLALAPVSWFLRGGLFFAGVALVGCLLRRRSAAWQAYVWRSALVASLILAAFTMIPWRPLPVPPATAGVMPTPVDQAFTFPGTGPAAVTQDLAIPGSADSLTPRSIGMASLEPTAVWWLWSLGAGWVVLRWLLALGQRERFAGQAREICDPEWLATLSRVTAPSKPPRLLRHPTAGVPCAWGVWRPTIMLPACADRWTADRRQMALRHEWSHLQRGDPLWQALAVLVLAVHWVNPVAWLALRRWRLSEEQVADDAVLRHAHAPDSYATLLFECARALASGPQAMPASSSMAQPSTVPVRIGRILDAGQDRRTPGWRCRALSVVGLGGCLLAILWLTPTLTAQATTDASKRAEAAAPRGKGEEPAKRLDASTAEGTAAAEVARNFLLSDGIEAKREYVRFPGKVAPLMRRWYAAHPSGPVQSTRDDVATQLTKLIHVDGMTFIVVTLQLLPSLEYKFFAVESTPQGLKLDWETAVGWQPMGVDEFRKARPTLPQPFRVHVGKGDYYNGPYADEKKWLCCDLTEPGDDSLRLFGYAERSSTAGKILAKHFADHESISAILGLAYPSEGTDPKQVTIHSIMSEQWFLKDGPAMNLKTANERQ